jgi:hypothetical protein
MMFPPSPPSLSHRPPPPLQRPEPSGSKAHGVARLVLDGLHHRAVAAAKHEIEFVEENKFVLGNKEIVLTFRV